MAPKLSVSVRVAGFFMETLVQAEKRARGYHAVRAREMASDEVRSVLLAEGVEADDLGVRRRLRLVLRLLLRGNRQAGPLVHAADGWRSGIAVGALGEAGGGRHFEGQPEKDRGVDELADRRARDKQ